MEFLSEATLGELYQKISALKDGVIETDRLSEKITVFRKVRNELVHEIISSKRSIGEINKIAQDGLKKADNLLQETWYRLEWIDDFYRE